MLEPEAVGVQGLPGETPLNSIPDIPQDRVAQVRQVDPELMGPAGLRGQLQKSGAGKSF